MKLNFPMDLYCNNDISNTENVLCSGLFADPEFYWGKKRFINDEMLKEKKSLYLTSLYLYFLYTLTHFCQHAIIRIE